MENNVRWDRNHEAKYDFRTLCAPIKNCYNCKHGVKHTKIEFDSRSFYEMIICPKQTDAATVSNYSLCDRHEFKNNATGPDEVDNKEK